jgi:hypothetical protein
MSPFRSCHARHLLLGKARNPLSYVRLSSSQKPSSLKSIGKDYENVIVSVVPP